MATVADTNGNGVPDPESVEVDVDMLLVHLQRLLEVSLGASYGDLRHPASLFGDNEADTRLRCIKFASTAEASSLYIQKLKIDTPVKENDEEQIGMFSSYSHSPVSLKYEQSDISIGCTPTRSTNTPRIAVRALPS